MKWMTVTATCLAVIANAFFFTNAFALPANQLVEYLGSQSSDGHLVAFSWASVHDWEASDVSKITGVPIVGSPTSWQVNAGALVIQHLATKGAQQHLLDFYWSPKHDWQVVDVTEKVGISISTDLTSWVTPNGQFTVEHLAAASSDGDLIDFYWSSQHDWQTVDVTKKVGIKVSSAGTSWQTKNGPYNVEHVAATSISGDLIDFYWSPQHDWQAVNVSQKVGLRIVGAVTSWQTPNGPFNVEHLAGRTPNGDLIDFYWSPQHDWQAVNISQKLGTKIAALPTAWQTPNGPFNVEHLAAPTSQGDLVDFYWSPQHDWQAVNVSTKVGVKITDAATSWQTPNGPFNVEHLAARSVDGSLGDFYWSPKQDWQYKNVSVVTGVKVQGQPTSWLAHDLPKTVAVVTQHNDNFRTGVQSSETLLYPALVKTFGMQLLYPGLSVTADIETQPLYVRSVPYPRGSADSIFVIASDNSLHSFNANNGKPNYSPVKLADTDPSTRPLPHDAPPTPVIDPELGIMYALFSTANKTVTTPNWVTGNNDTNLALITEAVKGFDVAYWLVAIDIATGAELRRVRVGGAVLGGDGQQLSFDSQLQLSHPSLLLDHGAVYVAFGANPGWEAWIPYHGWVFRYDAASFEPKGVFCTTAGLRGVVGEGAGIWQGGGGLAADSDGNVYFLTGNGPADPSKYLYGDSVVKLSPSDQGLVASGQYVVPQAALMDTRDLDLGAGGPALIPGTSMLVGGGKTGMLFLVDTSQLTTTGSAGLLDSYQYFTNTYEPSWNYGCPTPNPPQSNCENWSAGPHLHGSPIYWQGHVYDWSEKDVMKSIAVNLNVKTLDRTFLSGGIRATANLMPGGLSVLSANSNADGIIWSSLPSADRSILAAFDAETLQLLWQSQLPASSPSMSHRGGPTVADGRLLIPTSNTLLVYGLGHVKQLANQPRSPHALHADEHMMMEMRHERFNQDHVRYKDIKPRRMPDKTSNNPSGRTN